MGNLCSCLFSRSRRLTRDFDDYVFDNSAVIRANQCKFTDLNTRITKIEQNDLQAVREHLSDLQKSCAAIQLTVCSNSTDINERVLKTQHLHDTIRDLQSSIDNIRPTICENTKNANEIMLEIQQMNDTMINFSKKIKTLVDNTAQHDKDNVKTNQLNMDAITELKKANAPSQMNKRNQFANAIRRIGHGYTERRRINGLKTCVSPPEIAESIMDISKDPMNLIHVHELCIANLPNGIFQQDDGRNTPHCIIEEYAEKFSTLLVLFECQEYLKQQLSIPLVK